MASKPKSSPPWEAQWQREKKREKKEEQYRDLLTSAGSEEERRAMLLSKDEDGWTALLKSAANGREGCLRLLLEHSHSAEEQSELIMAEDSWRMTSLQYAARNGHTGCVRLLLQHARGSEEQGRMLAARNKWGKTALEEAEGNPSSNDETRRILREALAGKVPCAVGSFGKAYQSAAAGASGREAGEARAVEHQMAATHLLRMQNRWGTDVTSVLEGTHLFYTAGYLPPHTAKDCLSFVTFKEHAKVLAESTEKAAAVTKVNQGYAMVSYAYTMETELYTAVNRCMRRLATEELGMWRCYIYHLERAISQLPAIAGTVYRGLDIRIGKSVYKPGSSITWQAFSSASVDLYQILRFLKVTGDDISGTVFVITSLNARDVHSLSAYPDEEEVVFSPNTHFHVKQDVEEPGAKAELLPQLEEYDLSKLKVFRLEEL